MGWALEEDPWLGRLEQFPPVLHCRASFLSDINPGSLQKILVSALSSFQKTPMSREITVADRDGYSPGRVVFKIGIGNGERFDIFDHREEERVLKRIENLGSFNLLDLVFHLHYALDDGKRHRVHEDHYVVRLAFQPGRLEILLHHLKGVRRIQPDELVQLVIKQINRELERNKYSELEMESLNTT